MNVGVFQEGNNVQEEIVGGSLECAKVSAGILNDFLMGERTEINGVNDLVSLVATGAIISDCFYNVGWTKDTLDVIKYLRRQNLNAPLIAVGTNIGANNLVKYLGEYGEDIPIAGGIAICSPWDLLMGARFICSTTVKKLYDGDFTVGLQEYAQLHQTRYSRLTD